MHGVTTQKPVIETDIAARAAVLNKSSNILIRFSLALGQAAVE
jgi:hypothetical protein